jgi:undecaprenyl diphosphate synthase
VTKIEAPPERRPSHVAIIMDGNGRWARKRLLPRSAGHASGIAAVRRVVAASRDIGLQYLTLYAFSTENWRRPKTEIAFLMGLLRQYFDSDLKQLKSDNVRVRIIGAREGLENDIAGLVADAEQMTQGNTGLNLTFAFNYGGREEIVAAARNLARAVREGRLDPDAIDCGMFAASLQTAGIPDPDLLIRTSGEHRLSNFLLWQSAYAEFVFVDTLWPDFSGEDLHKALAEFAGRDRRFGGIEAEAGETPSRARRAGAD